MEENKHLNIDECDLKTSTDGASEGFDESIPTRSMRLANGREILVPEEPNRRTRIAGMVIAIIVAAVVRGIGTYCFIRPNGFAEGGVSGISVMLEYLTGINLGYFNLLINVPLLVLAYIFLSKRYFYATAGFTLVYSGTTIVMEQIDKLVGGKLGYIDQETAIISAVFGGVIIGIAFATMVRAGGSMGGTDVVAAIVQKKRPDIGVSWLVFMLDLVIVGSSFFVYKNGLTPILLAIIASFSSSFVADKLLKGSKSALKAEIITNHEEEICAEIFDKLGKGVTVLDCVGQYTGNSHKLLICVIKRRQVGDLERIIKRYPDTFSYIMPSNEVYGFWRK